MQAAAAAAQALAVGTAAQTLGIAIHSPETHQREARPDSFPIFRPHPSVTDAGRHTNL